MEHLAGSPQNYISKRKTPAHQQQKYSRFISDYSPITVFSMRRSPYYSQNYAGMLGVGLDRTQHCKGKGCQF